ncbi:type IVB secretion system protein IcmW [Marinobacter salarius]|uniref:Uncharacterized protein n=1 Tax=Marinobacter salarius TaxID=1420917 RepID=A0A1W6KFV6_9GAMM|nr:type IVB secretion system protein IcmW [Marinobacter salarius]ARM86209.1 hypothetical protein MARSALSMR5_04189 [Marinobacter salarius]
MELLTQTDKASSPTNSVGQHTYWKRIDDVAEEVVKIIDEKESWVIEGHPDFTRVLDELLGLVRRHPSVTGYIQSHPVEALKLMAYLHGSTAMMLIHVNAELRPQFVHSFLELITELVKTSPDGEVKVSAELALDRFLAFERTGLISRIFSRERIEGVLDAIERARASADSRRTN